MTATSFGSPSPRTARSRIPGRKSGRGQQAGISQLPLFSLPAQRPLMCNVFFALGPDATAKAQCASLLQSLRSERIALEKPVEVDRLHVSLCNIGGFFDQIPREHLPAARYAAAHVRIDPFTVTFDQLHSAKGHLLLRPSDGAPALYAFQEKLSKALIGAGMRRWMTWKFRPHLTLCYDAGAIPERTVAPVTWTVRDFVLIESLYGRHRHIERGRWALQP